MRRTATILLTFALICLVSLAVQYQVRLRLLAGEAITMDFSKGAWIECLSETSLQGTLDSVNLRGAVVTDTSGTFSQANASSLHNCARLGIALVNKTSKQYVVPFRFIGTIRRNSDQIWSNPLPS
jgi:hypothetical protein